MPLPRGGDLPWPPSDARAAFIRYGEWSAWYSGSPQELTRFYAAYAGQDRTGFFDPATTAQPYSSVWNRMKFWARQAPNQITRGRTHVPLAADISMTSASQLFSDPPPLLIPEAHVAKATRAAKAIQQRLDEIVDEDGIHSTFHEGAEICSGLGGVFMQAAWDKEIVSDRPVLQAIHPDSALPQFRLGKLASCIFWHLVEDDGRNVYRHLECHEPGVIYHGLYKGTSTKLGYLVPLTDMPKTAALATSVGSEAEIRTGLPGLDCVYIPNMLPNRADRSSKLGRSDYASSEGLMDNLDETWTSWMRDIRLGKGRLFVPEEFVQSQGRGKGASFDVEREIFEMLKMAPTAAQNVITPQQFAIRVTEHEATADALIERIVATAGYSGSTFGLKGTMLEKTATEVKARESRTLTTRGQKIGYWSPAISDILEAMLGIDQIVFGGPGAMRPRADFPERVQDSLLDTSTSIELLDRAKAISNETKVRMAHPNWDPEEVAAEVAAIANDRAAATAGMPVVNSGAMPGGAAAMPSGSPMGMAMPAADQGPMPPGTGGQTPAPTPPAQMPAQ